MTAASPAPNLSMQDKSALISFLMDSNPTLIDISVPVHPAMPNYTGNTPVSFEPFMAMDQGDWVNVTKVSLSTHMGTHFDAPHHILNNGQMMDTFPLSRYVGPARVIELDAGIEVIEPEHLKAFDLVGVKRLLVKTKSSGFWHSNPQEFRTDFAAFNEASARYIADCGVELIGIDYLSVELYDKPELLAHKAFMNGGVTILEGLDLSKVAPRDYILMALPLRFDTLDGAPGRAVLWDVSGG